MKTNTIFLLLLLISIPWFSSAQPALTVSPCTTPTVTIIGSTEICQGSATVICATGGTKYNWGNGDTTSCITVSPPTSITMTVEVSNPPCFKDTGFTILVDTMPHIRVTGDLLCHGDSTILHAYGGYTYLWSTGATTDSILGILDSTYYLTVTKGYCSVDSFKVTVTRGCLGIPNISNEIVGSISPNPCSNILNINLENQTDLSSIQIMDITGRVLVTDYCQLTTDHYTIDVSSLTPSMYFLRFSSGTGMVMKKFIKK